jgi:hypothetical protein
MDPVFQHIKLGTRRECHVHIGMIVAENEIINLMG